MISLRQAAALAAAFLSLAFTSSPVSAFVIVLAIVAVSGLGMAAYRRLRPPVPMPVPLRTTIADVEEPKPLRRSPYSRVR